MLMPLGTFIMKILDFLFLVLNSLGAPTLGANVMVGHTGHISFEIRVQGMSVLEIEQLITFITLLQF